ncbi:hypothetical protein SODALDRAFT_326700 [Sodiomyces alkalinus F11]|uniref:Uncharacterized protein n=1 Tax=Sodiomyces alkalinus (strain CBS 110278 / VKM F-3762 / F11) TaxID=1314773 RepID=A0A3N2Q715_SODAK|nr:hypothetical protein SODALDRAFT_326700 [Sodiomyces alkalinus F11]ROT42540.1 hypothetical protein SODALDRAFT_326700 [Sodiomyces alkalinus F11]
MPTQQPHVNIGPWTGFNASHGHRKEYRKVQNPGLSAGPQSIPDDNTPPSKKRMAKQKTEGR